MKRMTDNRRYIIEILRSYLPDCGGYAPFPASSILYMMESYHAFDSTKPKPNKRQVYRTLRDLWYGGTVVASRVLNDMSTLPFWELEYQMADSVDDLWIKSQCLRLHNDVDRAANGIQFV